MYWFGKNVTTDFNWQTDSEWSDIALKRRTLATTRLEKILDLLDAFSETSFEEAIPGIMAESGLSEEETRKTLALLPALLKKPNLLKRVRAEFIKSEVLDHFIKLPHALNKTRAVPQGIVLHVTAGNVFLSSLDSLIMGFLTKNISVVKVSGQNKYFPTFFAEKLKVFDKENILADKFAILYWKGGDKKTEGFIKSKVNTIIAWGGEEMIASYKKDLHHSVKFLDFGPKISIQLITKDGLNNKKLSQVAAKVVDDIIPWDQAACSSPQNLYIEEGVDETELLHELTKAFDSASARGLISADEATEILKEKYRGYYSELMEGGKIVEGKDFLLHLEKNKLLRPSPLNRSLILKRFKNREELVTLLEPFSYYLQSCSYLLGENQREEYLEALALCGLKRLAPLGTITWGMEGAPHDGRFVLRELVQFIGDERRIVDYGEINSTVNSYASIKAHFESTPHPKGYIFSSGGTTGEPKYLHFSNEEFDYMSDMLAENFLRHGLKPGMTVANLFVAGNLWSSFLCVDKALEKIGVTQLPIGGLCSNENILMYLKRFQPDVVMGIPSMLVMNAEFAQLQNEKIHIPMVFYAGEALTEIRKDYLHQIWGTKVFASAGYASVDGGVIGYQCQECGPGEHHVFSDLVELNILEDEALVTSLARESMPVKNYRTGDRIEWIADCSCGSRDRRFKLLGRIDNVIQIWSCRLLSNDIETVMSESEVRTYQLIISETREANVVREKLKICYERAGASFDQESFLLDLYNRSRDVKDTIKYLDFKKDIVFSELEVGAIPRNPRTGKISLIIDQRH